MISQSAASGASREAPVFVFLKQSRLRIARADGRKVECVLHHQVPRFEKVLPGACVTYQWQRRSGDSGVHTTLRRFGINWPQRLVRHLPPGLLRRFKVSNLAFQAAPAYETVEALKALALRNITQYWGR